MALVDIESVIDAWSTYIIEWKDGVHSTTIRARNDAEARAVARKFANTGGYSINSINHIISGTLEGIYGEEESSTRGIPSYYGQKARA